MFGPQEWLVIGLICGGPLLAAAVMLCLALRTRKRRLQTPMDRCKFCTARLPEGAGQASIVKLKSIAVSWGHANPTDWAWKRGPRCQACFKALWHQRPEWLRPHPASAEEIAAFFE